MIKNRRRRDFLKETILIVSGVCLGLFALGKKIPAQNPQPYSYNQPKFASRFEEDNKFSPPPFNIDTRAVSTLVKETEIIIKPQTKKITHINDLLLNDVVITSEDSTGYASNANKIISHSEDPVLYAVLKVKDNDGLIKYISATPKLKINNEIISPENILDPSKFEDVSVNWFKIESNSDHLYYSNTHPSWHWATLKYKETKTSWKGFKIQANVKPTILDPVFVDGIPVGTMRYMAEIRYKDGISASKSSESRFKGGISDDVHRISKKGNTGIIILDNAYALCNNPYIWGSASLTGNKFDNQAEHFVGADCADFVVAAHRLSGYGNLPYGGSMTLGPYVNEIASVKNSVSDELYTNHGKLVKIGQGGAKIGDIVLWNRHVGLLAADNAPLGYLGPEDEVLHTLFKEPIVEELRFLYPTDFKIVRAKESLRK